MTGSGGCRVEGEIISSDIDDLGEAAAGTTVVAKKIPLAQLVVHSFISQFFLVPFKDLVFPLDSYSV